MSEFERYPIFCGRTDDGEEIRLYALASTHKQYHKRSVDVRLQPSDEYELHVNDQVHLLDHGSTLTTWSDIDRDRIYLRIESPQWTGTAWVNKLELVEFVS